MGRVPLGDVYRYLALVFSQTGLSSMVAEELAIIPGMEIDSISEGEVCGRTRT